MSDKKNIEELEDSEWEYLGERLDEWTDMDNTEEGIEIHNMGRDWININVIINDNMLLQGDEAICSNIECKTIVKVSYGAERVTPPFCKKCQPNKKENPPKCNGNGPSCTEVCNRRYKGGYFPTCKACYWYINNLQVKD